jgi:biotin synthase-like enzyme
MIATLVEGPEDLFPGARALGRTRPLVLSSPLVMTRACRLIPLCRHCCWTANRVLLKGYADTTVTVGEAVERARLIERSGAERVYLVSGWMGSALPGYFFDCVEAIAKESSLDVTATFGAIGRPDLIRLRDSGVARVSCALETTNRDAFRNLKPGDNFGMRLETLENAKALGMRISTNYLVGIGESLGDLEESVLLAMRLGVDFLSFSSIQPTPYTESETWERPSPYYVARVAAAARIAMPDVDLSVSFGCDAYSDLTWGIRCGANAFVAALRNPGERPGLLGDETGRLRAIWAESA